MTQATSDTNIETRIAFMSATSTVVVLLRALSFHADTEHRSATCRPWFSKIDHICDVTRKFLDTARRWLGSNFGLANVYRLSCGGSPAQPAERRGRCRDQRL